MNMIVDNNQQSTQMRETATIANLQISTTPPTPPTEDASHEHNNNGSQLSSKTVTTQCGKNPLKRSFDVAFLMMPDERLQQNHLEKQQPPPTQQLYQLQSYVNLNKQPEQLAGKGDMRRYPHIMVRTPRVYDDPTVVISPSEWESSPSKSAFTKVMSRLESPGQPTPSLSPDQLSCSSISPPVATTPPRSASGSSSDIITIDNMQPTSPVLSPALGYHNFRPDYPPNGAFQTVQALHHQQRLKQQFLYRSPMLSTDHPTAASLTHTQPEFLPMYTAGFPFSHHPATTAAHHHPFAAMHQPELPRIVQNPAAAAILSTLIPPTLASTFTLTAQNVCAKCNISFRMTSDLVYHMRSHHKSEVTSDPNRRKREEKLKCPVCQESFRERHHLTRHMTAHQDKESDQTNTTPSTSNAYNYPTNQQHSRLSSSRTATYSK